MNTFKIGEGAMCNLDVLVNTRLLVQANSGAGKSWALRRLLEQTHGAIQHLVIDPEGEFASLRERYDYVLASRQGGDTLADPRTAKLLAERLLELGASAILDIYELNPDQRIRFVRLFLEALVDAPKSLWHPVLVVIDEAHVYCAEKDPAESAAAVKALCSRGRKRGFCAVLATQRLSKLAKDAAAECNNKLIGRCTLDLDMARAGDELGFSKSDRLQLRDLDAGEFFAFGDALTRTVTRIKVGGVETRHPKAGSHLAGIVPPPTSRIKALLPKLSDLPAEAEAREKSVADLKRDLANARRELTEARKDHPAPQPETVYVDRQVLKDGQLSRAEALVKQFESVASSLAAVLGEIAIAIGKARQPAAMAVGTRQPASVRQPHVADRVLPVPMASNGNSSLAGGERKILTALAQYLGGRAKTQVAILTGYAHNGGGFNNYISALRSKGYLEGSGDRLRITDAGVNALGSYAPLPTGSELLDFWLRQLGKAERSILEQLADAYPQGMSKPEVGAATNYEPNGGGFNNALSKLRSLELIHGRGDLRASDSLFDA